MSDDWLIIGGDGTYDSVIGVVRDDFGEQQTDYRYAFDHPEMYQWLGSDVESRVKVHYFRFVE